MRSGILNSIHAFGASTLGTPFLALIALLVLGSVSLVLLRRGSLASEHSLDSLLSREAIFLLQNLVLVAFSVIIAWGTFFPLISEALTGTASSVGPPWFDTYTVPLALVLVLLTGAGHCSRGGARRRGTSAVPSSSLPWPPSPSCRCSQPWGPFRDRWRGGCSGLRRSFSRALALGALTLAGLLAAHRAGARFA